MVHSQGTWLGPCQSALEYKLQLTLDTGWYLFASAKDILPYVLHTYLPISSGNTIPSYPPCASYISFLLSSPQGLQEAQKILPASSISCFGLSPLAYSTGDGALQHRPLFFFWFFPFGHVGHCAADLCLCTSGKTHPCLVCLSHLACSLPLDFSVMDCIPWSPLESPLSCSSCHWFQSTPTNIPFSLHLSHFRLFILVFLSAFSRPLMIRFIFISCITFGLFLVTICTISHLFCPVLLLPIHKYKNLLLYENCWIYPIKGF